MKSLAFLFLLLAAAPSHSCPDDVSTYEKFLAKRHSLDSMWIDGSLSESQRRAVTNEEVQCAISYMKAGCLPDPAVVARVGRMRQLALQLAGGGLTGERRAEVAREYFAAFPGTIGEFEALFDHHSRISSSTRCPPLVDDYKAFIAPLFETYEHVDKQDFIGKVMGITTDAGWLPHEESPRNYFETLRGRHWRDNPDDYARFFARNRGAYLDHLQFITRDAHSLEYGIDALCLMHDEQWCAANGLINPPLLKERLAAAECRAADTCAAADAKALRARLAQWAEGNIAGLDAALGPGSTVAVDYVPLFYTLKRHLPDAPVQWPRLEAKLYTNHPQLAFIWLHSHPRDFDGAKKLGLALFVQPCEAGGDVRGSVTAGKVLIARLREFLDVGQGDSHARLVPPIFEANKTGRLAAELLVTLEEHEPPDGSHCDDAAAITGRPADPSVLKAADRLGRLSEQISQNWASAPDGLIREYVAAFPDSFEDFVAIFGHEDPYAYPSLYRERYRGPLHDRGFDMAIFFREARAANPEVIRKAVGITRGAHWQSGAVARFQTWLANDYDWRGAEYQAYLSGKRDESADFLRFLTLSAPHLQVDYSTEELCLRANHRAICKAGGLGGWSSGGAIQPPPQCPWCQRPAEGGPFFKAGLARWVAENAPKLDAAFDPGSGNAAVHIPALYLAARHLDVGLPRLEAKLYINHPRLALAWLYSHGIDFDRAKHLGKRLLAAPCRAGDDDAQASLHLGRVLAERLGAYHRVGRIALHGSEETLRKLDRRDLFRVMLAHLESAVGDCEAGLSR